MWIPRLGLEYVLNKLYVPVWIGWVLLCGGVPLCGESTIIACVLLCFYKYLGLIEKLYYCSPALRWNDPLKFSWHQLTSEQQESALHLRLVTANGEDWPAGPGMIHWRAVLDFEQMSIEDQIHWISPQSGTTVIQFFYLTKILINTQQYASSGGPLVLFYYFLIKLLIQTFQNSLWRPAPPFLLLNTNPSEL